MTKNVGLGIKESLLKHYFVNQEYISLYIKKKPTKNKDFYIA